MSFEYLDPPGPSQTLEVFGRYVNKFFFSLEPI